MFQTSLTELQHRLSRSGGAAVELRQVMNALQVWRMWPPSVSLYIFLAHRSHIGEHLALKTTAGGEELLCEAASCMFYVKPRYMLTTIHFGF